jgi:hypothetical protein
MFSSSLGCEEGSGKCRFASAQAIRAPSWRDRPGSEITVPAAADRAANAGAIDYAGGLINLRVADDGSSQTACGAQLRNSSRLCTIANQGVKFMQGTVLQTPYSHNNRRQPVIANETATAKTAQPALASTASKRYSIVRRIGMPTPDFAGACAAVRQAPDMP